MIEYLNCYETRNHLWVIFEYCAGGDLLRLLKQDSRLPEDRATRQQVAGPGWRNECWTNVGQGVVLYAMEDHQGPPVSNCEYP